MTITKKRYDNILYETIWGAYLFNSGANGAATVFLHQLKRFKRNDTSLLIETEAYPLLVRLFSHYDGNLDNPEKYETISLLLASTSAFVKALHIVLKGTLLCLQYGKKPHLWYEHMLEVGEYFFPQAPNNSQN